MAVVNPYICSLSKHLFSYRTNKILSNGILKHLCTKIKENDVIDQIFPDVEGSPATLPENYFKRSNYKRHEKKDKLKPPNEKIDYTGHVIIECKNESLNHYINQSYNKFEPIPLASKGWLHRRSRGDFFKINILPDKENRENIFWSDGVESYENLGLDDSIVKAVNKLGFTRPTHIQADGIPHVLQCQNTLLAGETGCGKTLAFLLPVIQNILRWRTIVPDRKLNTPLAIILVPGRELAYQIGDVADQLSRELMFDLEVIVGGHTKRLLTHPNFRPVDLFISSTGVASKLTSSGVYNMSFVRHIVLDEAATILDDSFNELIVRFLRKFPISFGTGERSANKFPEFCKLTLCSATMPTSIADILGNVIATESLVKVETPRLHQVLCNVPQLFLRCNQSEKPTRLLELVRKNAAKDIPTIVFSNRAKVCDWVSMFLNENGISCVNLNGDMPVDVRLGRFDQFQRGFVDIISCTDMVSRGLDTVRAKSVINYDFPNYMADYIHRCGRLGRVGHTDGCLITNFVSGVQEVALTQKIETAVRTMSVLPNVNANITRVIHHRIMKNDNNIV